MTHKEEFISIYNKYISRAGSKELLDWMQKTDFSQLLQAQNIIAPVNVVL